MPVIPQRRFLYFKSYVDTCFFANFAANIRRLPSYPTTRHKKKQMMKKTFLLFILALFCQISFAQSPAEELLSQYSSAKHATFVKVPKPLMSMFLKQIVSKDSTAKQLTKCVDKLQVLVLDESSKSARKKCNKDVVGLLKRGFYQYARFTEDGSNVLVQTYPNVDNPTQILLSITGGDNCTLLLLDGNFNKEFFDQLTKLGKKLDDD